MDKGQSEKYQQALQLMAEEKWLDSAVILEDLINESPNDDVNRHLVRALYEAKQYQRAFVYFVEQPLAFTETYSEACLGVQLMLHNQSYMAARQFIVELPTAWQGPLRRDVSEAEMAADQKYRVTIQTLLRSFYHLGDCSLSEQQERLSEAQQLPLNDYLTGAQFLLRDPFTHELIKASIIDTLRQATVNKELTLQWIDKQDYQINPSQLQAIDDLPVVKELRQELNRRLGSKNPTQFQLASQELRLQLMLLYPLIEEKVTSPGEWIDYLIDKISGKKEDKKNPVGPLQDTLTEIIDDLSEKH